MVFGGFQKLTLLDFPGRVACIVFTRGCNFACPFCHNALLVEGTDGDTVSDGEVLAYLKKRQGILEGICISGGEPLLHPELEDFVKEVKGLGYGVKIDTNGSVPERLKNLVEKGLVDYVAMDIKNTMEKYPQTVGLEKVDTKAIEECIDFLLLNKVDYEFRTTVTAEHHTISDVEAIAKRIVGGEKYFLQNFVDSGNILGENLHPVKEAVLRAMESAAREYIKTAKIRGM